MKSCLRGLAVLLSLSVCWPDSTSLGQSTDLQLRIIERDGRQYVVWSDGKIDLVLDEETARKFGVIVEQHDSLAEELRLQLEKERQSEQVIRQMKARVAELENIVISTEAVWSGRMEECRNLTAQEQEHIKNLEAEKRPSHLKAYLIGGIVGAGVAAVLVSIGSR